MPLKTHKEDLSSMNLTPLIDIIFLLIIFFMVGSRFTELNEVEKDISLNVPHVTDAKALSSAPRNRVINVFQNGQIQLDDESVTLTQLHEKLAMAQQQYASLGVVVRGDASSKYQNVIDVIATCRQANITELNISVQQATKRR